ncbi:hypothetical protein V8B55DRAFT_1046970 [Mucor lusitanicus]
MSHIYIILATVIIIQVEGCQASFPTQTLRDIFCASAPSLCASATSVLPRYVSYAPARPVFQCVRPKDPTKGSHHWG